LNYELEFVVSEGSSVIGLTPPALGIQEEDGVQVRMLCRQGSFNISLGTRLCDGSRYSRRSICAQSPEEGPSEMWLAEATDPEEMKGWKFKAGDVVVARCSVQGIICMRRHPGVFALRGLHCNDLLGGRRYTRRLFECVVAEGSDLVGHTLEELLGLGMLVDNPLLRTPAEGIMEAGRLRIRDSLQLREAPLFLKQHLGYPLAGFRRCRDLQVAPLSFSADHLLPGDVLVVDAFQGFPTLPQTLHNFLVVSEVTHSQAPRHGRRLDKTRGIVAICFLVGAAAITAYRGDSLLLGTFIGVILCVVTRTVQVQQALQSLNWPMLLTFGAGAAVSQAIIRTGVASGAASAIDRLGKVTGTPGKLVAVALLAQVMANTLSNTPAGLIVAPLALEVAEVDELMSPHGMCILVVITCNMALSTPFATGSHASLRSLAGYSLLDFLRFGLPAQAIVTAVVVWWAYTSELGRVASADGGAAPLAMQAWVLA